MGQCSGTRPPPGAVCPSRKRDQEAARSNRRASPSSVPVTTSHWCAQEAADQAGEASIRSSEEQDRSRHHSAHRGGLELGTGTGPYGACRSTQCCLAVWSRWLESSTCLGGFRALKKTTEAPYSYTTKVNYRDHTSRGTTRYQGELLGLWDPQNRDRRRNLPPETDV